MLKSWMHDISLAMRARSGVTPALFVWLAIVAAACVTAFVFLCIAGYDWLAPQLGNVFAGLVMAGGFLLIALICLIAAGISRRRARDRAILERAARAQTPPAWLLDPKVLAAAAQAGRTLGWQRLVPLALFAFLAAQWARERRERRPKDGA